MFITSEKRRKRSKRQGIPCKIPFHPCFTALSLFLLRSSPYNFLSASLLSRLFLSISLLLTQASSFPISLSRPFASLSPSVGLSVSLSRLCSSCFKHSAGCFVWYGLFVRCSLSQPPGKLVARLLLGFHRFYIKLFRSTHRPVLTLLYPLYASVVAIESPSKEDDQQWLSYWILYSFLTLAEMVLQPVLEWIPIWYDGKLLLVAWLALPCFNGAAFLYERFVREQIRKHVTGREQQQQQRHISHKTAKSPKAPKGKKKFVDFITPKKGDQEVY